MEDVKIINIVNEIVEALTFIPEGSFLMGSKPEDEGTWEAQYPQHLVHVQSFLMGKFPVTQIEWQAISHLSKVNIELPSNPSESLTANSPVTNIDWYEALEFCNRLSAFTGRYITLPSEAQWEYAYTAGTSTTKCYCGEDINTDLANYNSYRPNVVESYTPNPYGLYVMGIFEWCLDDYHSNYKDAPTDGSPWLDNPSAVEVILRGHSTPRFRWYSSAQYVDNDIGFRICSSS